VHEIWQSFGTEVIEKISILKELRSDHRCRPSDALQEFARRIRPNTDQPQSEFHQTIDGTGRYHSPVPLSVLLDKLIPTIMLQPQAKPLPM
jgi:hypothetical protein